MALEVSFDTDNAAFEDDGGRMECARILRELADKLENGSQWEGGIYDVNGNRVGTWNLDEPGTSCCNGVGCDQCEPEDHRDRALDEQGYSF